MLRFSGDRRAMFTCSFGAADISEYQVVGTKGLLRADPAYEYTSPLKLTIKIADNSRGKTFPKSDQFAPELIYFSDCILMSGREGLADVQVITALYESVRTGKPVRIRAVEPEKRPAKEQEIRRPPNPEPEKVHARAPSE